MKTAPERPPARPSTRGPAAAVAALAVAAGLALGCGPGEAAREGWIEHPHYLSLAAFSDFRGASLETAGAPERRWIPHRGREVPAVVGGDSFGLGLRLPELSGAAVSAAYGYLAGDAGDTEAVFQVIAVPASGEKVVLFQDRPRAGADERWRTLRAAVKERASGPGWLRFEVVYVDGEGGRTRAPAAWVDPVVEVTARHRSHPLEGRWNLVLVTADTTRPDFLGVYGGPARTPALERLARAGVVFEEAHTVATGTTPAHASLFTGLPSRRHGLYTNRSVLEPELVTLAEALEDGGYATAAFVAARPLARAVGLDQGFRWFDDVFDDEETSGLGRFSQHERRADRVVSRFQQWLGSEASETPFAAWLHFFDPHQPYAPPDHDPAGESAALRRWFEDESGPKLVFARSVADRERAFEALNRAARRRYTAEIEFLDAQLGRLLDDLEGRGLLDRSVVLFLSDHGENFGDRGAPAAFHHAGLHGDVTRLAMVLKLPGSRAGGTRTSLLVPSSDVPCTLLDALGVRRPESWSCASFLGLVADPGAPGNHREHLILEGPFEQEIAVRTPRYLLRTLRDGAKDDASLYGPAAFSPGRPTELYDLGADPGETVNVYDRDEHRPQAERLRRILDDFLHGSPQPAPPTIEDSEHLEGLKALGYLD